MKNVLKLLYLWLLDIGGINALCRLVNRDKAIIIIYHGICDEGFNLLKGYDVKQLSKSYFRKQLEYLKRKGYVFCNMTELTDTIKNKGKICRFVVLTFDDGYNNVIDNAYPIMKEFGAKGCFYLVSTLIGQDHLLWTDHVEMVIRNHKGRNFIFNFLGKEFDYRLDDEESCHQAMKEIKAKLRSISDKERLAHLQQFEGYRIDNVSKEFRIVSPGQIKQLDQNILEIGSHTRMHPNCVNLTSDEELENEILNSKIDIERMIGKKITHFCYPKGSYDIRVTAKVIESGYDSAVTTAYGLNDNNSDLFRLNRMEANEQLLFFKASSSGSYLVAQRTKDVLMMFLNVLRRGFTSTGRK